MKLRPGHNPLEDNDNQRNVLKGMETPSERKSRQRAQNSVDETNQDILIADDKNRANEQKVWGAFKQQHPRHALPNSANDIHRSYGWGRDRHRMTHDDWRKPLQGTAKNITSQKPHTITGALYTGTITLAQYSDSFHQMLSKGFDGGEFTNQLKAANYLTIGNEKMLKGIGHSMYGKAFDKPYADYAKRSDHIEHLTHELHRDNLPQKQRASLEADLHRANHIQHEPHNELEYMSVHIKREAFRQERPLLWALHHNYDLEHNKTTKADKMDFEVSPKELPLLQDVHFLADKDNLKGLSRADSDVSQKILRHRSDEANDKFKYLNDSSVNYDLQMQHNNDMELKRSDNEMSQKSEESLAVKAQNLKMREQSLSKRELKDSKRELKLNKKQDKIKKAKHPGINKTIDAMYKSLSNFDFGKFKAKWRKHHRPVVYGDEEQMVPAERQKIKANDGVIVNAKPLSEKRVEPLDEKADKQLKSLGYKKKSHSQYGVPKHMQRYSKARKLAKYQGFVKQLKLSGAQSKSIKKRQKTFKKHSVHDLIKKGIHHKSHPRPKHMTLAKSFERD